MPSFNGIELERRTRIGGILDALYPFVSYALDRFGTAEQKKVNLLAPQELSCLRTQC